MEYVSPEGLRQDGRRAVEFRQLRCKVDVLSGADGSAVFEFGNTKVLAAVSGPKAGVSSSGAVSGAVIKCEVAFASFASGDRRRRGRRERRVQDVLTAVQAVMEQTVLLDLMPGAEIDIFLQVLHADGSEKAACINAAMLAIANAGIPVRDLVGACTVGYLESTSLLDLNLIEIQAQGPETTLAAYPTLEQVVYIDSSRGTLQIDSYEEVCDLAVDGCKGVSEFLTNYLKKHTTRLAACRGIASS